MIAAVTTVINEADIVRASFEHLYLEGIDAIYVAHGQSTDDTLNEMIRASAGEHPLNVAQDFSEYHRQPYWIERLANAAGDDGAEWIIPFDADEFWYSTEGSSIAATLHGLPEHVCKVRVPMIRHFDWNHRLDVPTLPKVAYRYAPGITVANGNHDCSAVGTDVSGLLQLREICFRNFDHFVRKTRERNALIDPALNAGEGVHQRKYAGMTEEQLWGEWMEYASFPRTYDPIPSRLREHP